jgi:hypothetical protein
MKWKPDKARGSKRENKQKLKRQQERKEFAKNMQRAEETAQKWCNETYDMTMFMPGSELADEFVDWAIRRYKHLNGSENMSQKHKDMYDTWQEIVATAEACKKATAARTYTKRREQQKRAAAAFRADRTQARLEAAARIGAKMQAKMQERALC